MKIGYYVNNYAAQRNIIGKVRNAKYKKIHDLYEIPRYSIMLANKLSGRQLYDPINFSFRHSGIGLNQVDLIHFFNAISQGNTPWLTTFETIVPRIRTTLDMHHGLRPYQDAPINDVQIRQCLDAMASSKCKALIAISKCNLEMQIEFLKLYPDYEEAIRKKLHQLYPPQARLIESYDQKAQPSKSALNFMFVGRLFFRKGGLEVLQVLEEVRQEVDIDIRLTIVSSMLVDEFARRETPKNVTHQAKAIIDENRDWITVYENVPNNQVLEMMKSADVGLLPTYADTFGYSLLEFQAAGCPVISTNVRALSEINDVSKGWIINVPKNELGEALHSTKSQLTELSQAVRSGLKEIVVEILQNPLQVRAKAKRAIDSIDTNHNLQNFSQQLERIYADALNQ